MRTRTPVVLFLAAALGAVVSRRALARLGSSALSGSLSLAGYGPYPRREPVAQPDLLKLRRAEAERNKSAHRRVLVRLLERIKAEHDRYTAGAQKEPPALDLLIVSGGGDWGAFGAGSSSRPAQDHRVVGATTCADPLGESSRQLGCHTALP